MRIDSGKLLKIAKEMPVFLEYDAGIADLREAIEKAAADVEYICPVNGEPCCQCMPGSPPPCAKKRG